MTRRGGGFTLIEVAGAALVFMVGVLMVISLSRALSRQMERAAIASTVTVQAQQRMDSLMALPYASLVPGTSQETLSVRGVAYRRSVTITQFSPLLREITVVVEPVSGSGPAHATTSYSSDRW